MQIQSALIRACLLAASEKLGESIIRIQEIGVAGIVRVGMSVIRRRKITIEVMLLPLRTRRIDLAVVEACALLGIGEQIVGTSGFLELLFGSLVAWIEIRM